MNYKIALFNVWWSEDDLDTRHFDTTDEQASYFDALAQGKVSDLVNFDMGDNITTVIYYRDTSGRSIEDLCRCNYACVYKYGNNGEIISRRYFFANPSQESGGQMRVELSLDDIQTNFIGNETAVKPCRIIRANLDRFIEDSSDPSKVRFDCSPSSKMFISEPLQGLAKRLTKRTALKANGLSNSVIEWFDNNVVCWECLFVTNQTIKVLDARKNQNTQKNFYLGPTLIESFENYGLTADSQEISELPCQVFFYPILKPGAEIVIQNESGATDEFSIRVSNDGYNGFRELNNNNSLVYARKLTLYNPLINFIDNSNFVNISSNENTGYTTLTLQGIIADFDNKNYVVTGTSHGDITVIKTISGTFDKGMFYMNDDIYSDNDFYYTSNKQYEFLKTEIIGQAKNVMFNPKLLGQQFFEMNCVVGSQKFTYDAQKLGNNALYLKYTEPLTPDVTKGYLRVIPTSDDCIYLPDCGYNYTGLVFSNDMSVMVDNDKLSEFLANNKNFLAQKMTEIATDGLKSFTNIASGDAVGGISGISGMVSKGLNTAWTIDNMRNAPRQLDKVNGSAYFNYVVTRMRPYIEEYDILDNEKEIVNDFMCQYGYLYNQDDNISNFTHTRKYYNYIEADVDVISSSISNEEKMRLRDKLKNVRFWHSDNIQYNLENYELWLEDGGN